MNISTKLIYMCATVLTAVLSVGCSQSDNGDDPDDPGFETGIPTEVHITLSSRSGNGTRANGIPKDPVAPVEFIHNWWIAFVDANGNVTILTRDNAQEKVNSITSGSLAENAGGGFEVETFKATIPTGHYNIYAFANIDFPPPSQSVDASLSDVEKAEKAIEKLLDSDHKISGKGLEDIIGTGNFTNNGMQWPSDKNIPMTGFIEGAWVRNTVEESFSIEVIRAVAKVEFSFTNPTADVITLKSLQFGPITKSNVSLLPQYSVLGHSKYSPFGTAEYGFPSFGLEVPNENVSESETESEVDKNLNISSFQFYCKETLAPSTSADADEGNNVPATTKDLFTILLTIDKTSNGITTTDVKRTLYTTVVKDYINRNDWIYIPIKFNDWEIKWKLHYYPPIGGYPPVFKQKADGSTLSATLTTGGEFELYPVEVKQNNKTYTVDMTRDDMTAQVKSGTDLFITEAQVIDNPNKDVTGHPLSAFGKIIAGELDPKKTGDAEIKIKFYLQNAPNITEGLTCLFTIHRTKEVPKDND